MRKFGAMAGIEDPEAWVREQKEKAEDLRRLARFALAHLYSCGAENGEGRTNQ